MKLLTFTVATLGLAASASAFSVSARRSATTSFKAATMDNVAVAESAPAVAISPPLPVEETAEIVSAASTADEAWKSDPTKRVQPGRYNDAPMSIALPFLKRPTQLDGSHAGDYGFDPLGLTEPGTGYDLYTMQESELRHGRLAMLAVVGWPLSELVAPSWMLQGENGLAPSVLNGFNPLTFIATALFLGGVGFFEYKTALRRIDNTPLGKKHFEDMELVWDMGVAGDYSFDPLNLYSSLGDDALSRKGLREVEISHGRSAMLGITGFAAWEFLTGHAVTESFAMFFTPNLVLPALGAAYLVASSVYELEDSDQYLRLKVSSEGEARLENFNRQMANAQEDNAGNIATAGVAAEKAVELAGQAIEWSKKKYAEINEEYYSDPFSETKQE